MAALPVAAATSQTITFNPLPDRNYGDAPFDVSGYASASSGLPVSFSSLGKCTVAGTTVTITGAGVCTIKANQAGNATFNPAPLKVRSFRINRAALTITADDKTRPSLDSNPAFTAQYSGFVYGEDPSDLGGSLTCTSTGISVSPAGTYRIFCFGRISTNYKITYVNGTLTITKLDQTITFDPISNMTFGDPPFTLSPAPTASSGLFVKLTATGPCTVPASSWFGPIKMTGTGLCTITAHQPGNRNYNAAPDVPQSFNINP